MSLIDLLADRLHWHPVNTSATSAVATAQPRGYLAERTASDVTGVTVSAAQAQRAPASRWPAGSVTIQLQDWLTNDFPSESFDRAYAIESSEHMPDKQRFFNEAFRMLKPSGLFGVCAWLAATTPAMEVRYLLEPICREGRLPGMGDEADYRGSPSRPDFELIRSRTSVSG